MYIINLICKKYLKKLINEYMEQNKFPPIHKPTNSFSQNHFIALPSSSTTEEDIKMQNFDRTSTFKRGSHTLQMNENKKVSSAIGNERGSFDSEIIKKLEYLEECQKNISNICYASISHTMNKNQKQESNINSTDQNNRYSNSLQPASNMYNYRKNSSLQNYNYEDGEFSEFSENTSLDANSSCLSSDYQKNAEKKVLKEYNKTEYVVCKIIIGSKIFFEFLIFTISILELIYILYTYCSVEIHGANKLYTFFLIGNYSFIIISILMVNILSCLKSQNLISVIIGISNIILMVLILLFSYIMKHSLIYFVVEYFVTNSEKSFFDFLIPINCF